MAALVQEYLPRNVTKTVQLKPTATFLNTPQAITAVNVSVGDGPYQFNLIRKESSGERVRTQLLTWKSEVKSETVVDLSGIAGTIQVRNCHFNPELPPQGWNGTAVRHCDPQAIIRNAYPDPQLFLEIIPLFDAGVVMLTPSMTGNHAKVELYNGGIQIARSSAFGERMPGLKDFFTTTPIAVLRRKSSQSFKAFNVDPACAPGALRIPPPSYESAPPLETLPDLTPSTVASRKVRISGQTPPQATGPSRSVARQVGHLNIKAKKAEFHIFVLYGLIVIGAAAGLLLK
jgi:hypothetical protein